MFLVGPIYNKKTRAPPPPHLGPRKGVVLAGALGDFDFGGSSDLLLVPLGVPRRLQPQERKRPVNPFATVIVFFLPTFAIVLQLLFPIRLTPHSQGAHRYLGTPSLPNEN